MKKTLSLLLVLLFLLALPLGAFAENAAEKGLAAIRETGWEDMLVLPKDESYLDEWKTLYCRKAFRAPCLAVERVAALHTGYMKMPFLYEGTEVTVVAEENDMSCILYRSSDNELYAGWIQSIRLLDEFPGKCITLGEAPEDGFTFRNGITLRWSGEGWRTAEQYISRQYSILSEEVRNCVGFTLEYQLIAENTYKWDCIYGPREIYVRSGGEWTWVGTFAYPEKGTVKVQVWLDSPMDIDAIGTNALCGAPDVYEFRQTAADFAVMDGQEGSQTAEPVPEQKEGPA